MIRELGKSIGNAVMESVGRAASRVQERRPLPVDLLESEDEFLAVFDAPGTTSSDVQVRFENNTVRVRLDRFREFYEDFEMLVPGRGLSLDGSVTLPADAAVEPGEATATLARNGTLKIRIPKSEDATGMTVTDEASDESTVEIDDAEDASEEDADAEAAAGDEPDEDDEEDDD